MTLIAIIASEEHDKMLREFLGILTKQLDVKYASYRSPGDALAPEEREKPDVVFCSVAYGANNWKGLANQLRKKFGSPVVYVGESDACKEIVESLGENFSQINDGLASDLLVGEYVRKQQADFPH
jgi:hypothetical protein